MQVYESQSSLAARGCEAAGLARKQRGRAYARKREVRRKADKTTVGESRKVPRQAKMLGRAGVGSQPQGARGGTCADFRPPRRGWSAAAPPPNGRGQGGRGQDNRWPQGRKNHRQAKMHAAGGLPKAMRGRTPRLFLLGLFFSGPRTAGARCPSRAVAPDMAGNSGAATRCPAMAALIVVARFVVVVGKIGGWGWGTSPKLLTPIF